MGADSDKILKDVEATGFPTELRVAALLHEFGWGVNQNLYYVDKDENKGRELDILASFSALDRKK